MKIRGLMTRLFHRPTRALANDKTRDVALEGPYPNGSVPYGDSAEHPESSELRMKRFACASLNHHPRLYGGSWCMGFGYVCGRCRMYADPVSQRRLEQMCEMLNSLPPQNQQAAAAHMSKRGTDQP